MFKVGRGLWSGSSSIRLMNMRSRISGGRSTMDADVSDILIGSLDSLLKVDLGKGNWDHTSAMAYEL